MLEPSQEDLNTGLLLFIPYRAMEDEVLTRLSAAGFGEITLARARVFQRIDAGGSRLTDLAQRAQVTKQTAAGLVDELERAGYVERVPDPGDARARLIRVAARGAAAVEVAAGVVAEVEDRWMRHLGRKRMSELRATLAQLLEITDPGVGRSRSSGERQHSLAP